MDIEEAIAAWVDGDPEPITRLPEGDDLHAGMLDQERMAQALAAIYDSGQASARVRASVMADIRSSAPQQAREIVSETAVKKARRKRSDDDRRTFWIGAWLAAAACVALVLLARLFPPAEYRVPGKIVAAPTPGASPAIPESSPELRMVESTPPPQPSPSTPEIQPAPSPAYVEATPPPLPSIPLPEASPSPETSVAAATPTPPPVVAVALATRDPRARPFADTCRWNLPLAADSKLSSVRLAGQNTNLRIGLRWQPVFVSEIQMPERELWVGDSRLGVLRMPAAVDLQMFRQSPLILVSADGLTAWEVTEPRPIGEGRIGAAAARHVDLAGDVEGEGPGQPLLAGIIRPGELENGIPHALSLGLPSSLTRSKCRLGSRIAISKNLDPEKFGAAREIARALRDYGGVFTFESKSDAVEILSADHPTPGIQSGLLKLLEHLRKVSDHEGN
ncbi:MAG: hypothetical protein NTV93_11630 [Verrucomicrobia bacterium]|nr:hypothetical protein [Verrucomicrobiota bacterium]